MTTIRWPRISSSDLRAVPATLHKGDSLEIEFGPGWIRTEPPYDLHLDFSRDGLQLALPALAITDDTNPTFTAAPDALVSLTAGPWRYRAYTSSSRGTIVTTIETGVTLVDDPSADTKTRAEGIATLLEQALQTKLEGRGDIASYSIGDRSIATYSLSDLRKEIAYWREVANYQLHGRESRVVGGFSRRGGRGGWPWGS